MYIMVGLRYVDLNKWAILSKTVRNHQSLLSDSGNSASQLTPEREDKQNMYLLPKEASFAQTSKPKPDVSQGSTL